MLKKHISSLILSSAAALYSPSLCFSSCLSQAPPHLKDNQSLLIGQLTHAWASSASNNRAAVLNQFLRDKAARHSRHTKGASVGGNFLTFSSVYMHKNLLKIWKEIKKQVLFLRATCLSVSYTSLQTFSINCLTQLDCGLMHVHRVPHVNISLRSANREQRERGTLF